MSVERIEADYLLETAYDPATAAAAMAGEQSSGTFVPVPGETPELKARSAARVERLEVLGAADHPSLPGSGASADGARRVTARTTLSWPLENIGPSLPNLMATVAGNLFELKQFSGLRLLDIRLPDAFANAYPGPRFGVDWHAQTHWRPGATADRHDRETFDRLHAAADRGVGGRSLRRRHRLHQGRRAAVGRTRLPVRRTRARGDVGDQSARRARRAESHVRFQLDRRNRRDAASP